MGVVAEAELFKDWVPLVKLSEISFRVTHFRQFGHFSVWLPPPLDNRAVFVQVSGLKLADDEFFLTVTSVPQQQLFGHPINRVKKTVYCDVFNSHFHVQVLDKTTGRLVVTSNINIDPKMKNIPNSLITFVMQKVVIYITNKIEKRARNLPAIYRQLIA